MPIDKSSLLRRISGVAYPALSAGSKAVEMEREDERGEALKMPAGVKVPLPEKPGTAVLYVTGDIIPGLSNEFTFAVHPTDPQKVAVSGNDYSDGKPHGYVETSTDAAQHFKRERIGTLDKKRPINGDMILRPNPLVPGSFYGAEMAFSFENMNNNGMKVFTVRPDGTVDKKSLKYVMKHSGAFQDFEDKENLAVDLDPQSKTYGYRLFTNTAFHQDNSSQINVYIVDPQNRIGRAIRISGNQDEVQWSAPVFGKDGTIDVAYRNFSDNRIYNVHSSGIELQKVADSWWHRILRFLHLEKEQPRFTADFEHPVPVVAIGNPVDDYFRKYDPFFRALSAPSMDSNPADGSLYLAYDDAKSGASQTYLMVRNPEGQWSDPQAIGAPGVDHWMSSVAVDSKTGIVAVTYRALRSDGDTYTREGILSFDGGHHWTDPVTMSLKPSLRTQDGFDGQFDGDYEETGVGTQADQSGNTVLYFYAPHQETPSGKDMSHPTLRVGTLVANLPTDLIEKARSGDDQAHAALNTLVQHAASGLKEPALA